MRWPGTAGRRLNLQLSQFLQNLLCVGQSHLIWLVLVLLFIFVLTMSGPQVLRAVAQKVDFAEFVRLN